MPKKSIDCPKNCPSLREILDEPDPVFNPTPTVLPKLLERNRRVKEEQWKDHLRQSKALAVQAEKKAIEERAKKQYELDLQRKTMFSRYQENHENSSRNSELNSTDEESSDSEYSDSTDESIILTKKQKRLNPDLIEPDPIDKLPERPKTGFKFSTQVLYDWPAVHDEEESQGVWRKPPPPVLKKVNVNDKNGQPSTTAFGCIGPSPNANYDPFTSQNQDRIYATKFDPTYQIDTTKFACNQSDVFHSLQTKKKIL